MNDTIRLASKFSYGVSGPAWFARSSNPAFNDMYMGRTVEEAREALRQWNLWRVENGFAPVALAS